MSNRADISSNVIAKEAQQSRTLDRQARMPRPPAQGRRSRNDGLGWAITGRCSNMPRIVYAPHPKDSPTAPQSRQNPSYCASQPSTRANAIGSLLWLSIVSSGCANDSPQPIQNSFHGANTGAWTLLESKGENPILYMSDSGSTKVGSLTIIFSGTSAGDGGSTSLTVMAQGCNTDRDFGASFEGIIWQSKSTEEKIELAKAALVKQVNAASNVCGVSATSVQEEFVSFDAAFAVFLRWQR